ncbi:hypothetical protein BS17DRAFT_772322 [Gyrodon lividus]|nr:hypothetical protein BS17DRAFT_772322 [Gyrodon lividus]
MSRDNRDMNTKVRDGNTEVWDGNAEIPGQEVRGLECPMKEKLSKVKSEARDLGFDHRGSELGRMG